MTWLRSTTRHVWQTVIEERADDGRYLVGVGIVSDVAESFETLDTHIREGGCERIAVAPLPLRTGSSDQEQDWHVDCGVAVKVSA
jgi:hypothetical protein